MRVLSGGQTGADQGFLIGAAVCGIATGGWAPRGWRTHTGPAPWLAHYGLREHASYDYRERTWCNVADAQGVVFLGNAGSPGGRCTLKAALALRRPFHLTPFPWQDPDVEAQRLRDWIHQHGITVIDGAGNREHTNPGICAAAIHLMRAICPTDLP